MPGAALSLVMAAEVAWHSHQAQCPLQQCRMKEARERADKNKVAEVVGGPSFLELEAASSEPNRKLLLDTSAPSGKVHDVDPDTGRGLYDVQWHSGHFMCSRCDRQSCPTCDVMCDLSSCMGEFYTQECWCRKESQVKLKTPLWWYREYDARWMVHDTVKRGFCADDCTGALCDVDGLQCKKREEACRPWWWCGLDPPKEEEQVDPGAWPTGFEYTSSLTFLQQSVVRRAGTAATEAEGAALGSAAHRNRELQQARAHRASAGFASTATATAKDKPEFEPNDYGKLSFETGSWNCGQASLPPKIQDANTRLWVDRGYIVFDAASCEGGAFDNKCFCWDNFKYLKGEDPLTSELLCDSSCGLGPCAGNTCSSSPPPPPTVPPPPPPVDPLEIDQIRSSELKVSNNKMDPLQ